jgi:hypothetical protein
MLDPQTRQQLQTKYQQVKPQLKQRFSGVTDQDLDAVRSDPDKLITTNQPEDRRAAVPRRGGGPLPGGLRLAHAASPFGARLIASSASIVPR